MYPDFMRIKCFFHLIFVLVVKLLFKSLEMRWRVYYTNQFDVQECVLVGAVSNRCRQVDNSARFAEDGRGKMCTSVFSSHLFYVLCFSELNFKVFLTVTVKESAFYTNIIIKCVRTSAQDCHWDFQAYVDVLTTLLIITVHNRNELIIKQRER